MFYSNNMSNVSVFELLRHLQYGAGSDFGQNLNLPPSRIIPLSLREMNEDNSEDGDAMLNLGALNIRDTEAISEVSEISQDAPCVEIPFVTPRLGEETLICRKGEWVPEPAAYFQPPHTFLQSILYLRSPAFFQSCHLPRKRHAYIHKYLVKALGDFAANATGKRKEVAKKLIQKLLSDTGRRLDTDPEQNPNFALLYDILFPKEQKQENVIVIQTNEETSEFSSTTPEKLPLPLSTELAKDEIGTTYLLVCKLPSGLFAPYGRTFSPK